jgi:hypothetical protein
MELKMLYTVFDKVATGANHLIVVKVEQKREGFLVLELASKIFR